jgi:hypothetical protein
VSSIWFLLPTWQVAIGTWGNSLPVCTRWSGLFLLLPGGSFVTLCLVIFSPSKVGQFSFEYHPQSHKTSSGIHQDLLWEVGLSLYPHSHPLLLVSS